ncbi:MAG TPA: cobyric acid synthase [Candidatus Acidoferrales bacterium]|nr:cobyric acid synthase [Candidatus Acidoferrales bacterium]
MKTRVAAPMKTRALMVLGTASHVGKSILVTALCRIFAQDGISVAPFKAQNMSLNSAATPDGLEIGRAQALQAEAAGIAARAEMNPVLLKPTGDRHSQVVVLGRIWGDVDAFSYHRRRGDELFPTVVCAYERLAEAHDMIVLEGAGSPAEINLKQTDIVNLRMAQAADARCILVGDIDRGGVFASLLGTLELLEPHERARIVAFVINKFRGDLRLLRDGIVQIERRLGIPCAGVVPWIADLRLDDEDSVSLEDRPRVTRLRWADGSEDSSRALRVAVVALPHLSNFTDFDALAAEPSVELGYAKTPQELEHADLVILPGSKATIADLTWLREQGLADAVADTRRQKLVVGICGGMQMLGRTIADPYGVEGGGAAEGLGLLSIETLLRAQKTTTPVHGSFAASTLFGEELNSFEVSGYEIHVGETRLLDPAEPLLRIRRAATGEECFDGASACGGRVVGTYVHGLFAPDEARHAFVCAARAAAGLAAAPRFANVGAERAAELDRLADHVRAALDLSLLHPTLAPAP